MRRFIAVLTVVVLFGCMHNGAFSTSSKENEQEYSEVAISLSDFSMKIVGYYGAQKVGVPKDFDTKQFFTLLGKIYPDQPQVQSIQKKYRVSVRGLDGGYSVMLCDPQTDQKIMEDLSCHLNRVEIQPWQNKIVSPCVFENNWKSYCE